MAKRFSVESVFTAIDRISRPIDRMSRRVDRFARKTRKVMRSVGNAVAGVARTARNAALGVAAGVAVVGAGVQRIVDKGADFEQTMVSAGTKFTEPIKKGTEDFKKLEETALRVGGNTEFTAKQAAGALEFMAKAGENAEVSMGALASQVDLATASQIDLDRATDIASDSIGPLGLQAETTAERIEAYAKAADLMATTTAMANLGAEELFESVKAGAGTFKGAGQDVETFLGAVGVLAADGIKGSKAGKDLARVFARLGSKGGEAAKQMKRLGLSIKEPKTGKIKELPQILTEIKAKTDKMSEGRRLAVLFALFGKNSKAAGDALLSNIPKLEEYTEKARQAEGESARMAETMRDTTAGGIKSMASAFEAIELAAFKEIQPEVDEIVKSVTDWMRLHKQDVAKAVRVGLEKAKQAFVELKPVVMDVVSAVQDMIENWEETKATLKTVLKIYLGYKAAMVAIRTASIALKVANWALSDSYGGLARSSRAAAGALRGGKGLRGALNASASTGKGFLGSINKINSKLGKAGLQGAALAAGFAVGAMLGEFLDEKFDVSGKINSWINELSGLNDQMDRMEKRTKREAVTELSIDDQIERFRSDAEKDLEQARKIQGTFGGTFFGDVEGLTDQARAGFQTVAILEARRAEMVAQGIDPSVATGLDASPQTEPQVVNANDAVITEVREIREQKQEVTINIKDPSGVAEVEQPALQDTVQVKKSGGI